MKKPISRCEGFSLRTHSDTALFLDNSFIDDRTSADIVRELLTVPGRLHVTNEVRKELQPYLRERPSHPLAVAIAVITLVVLTPM